MSKSNKKKHKYKKRKKPSPYLTSQAAVKKEPHFEKIDIKPLVNIQKKNFIISLSGILIVLIAILTVVAIQSRNTNVNPELLAITTSSIKTSETNTTNIIPKTKTLSNISKEPNNIFKDSKLLSQISSIKDINYDDSYYINLNKKNTDSQIYTTASLTDLSNLDSSLTHKYITYKLLSGEKIYIYIPDEYIEENSIKTNMFFSGRFEEFQSDKKTFYILNPEIIQVYD